MSGLKHQRVDALVYILWDMVLPDIMQDHMRIAAEFTLRKMNKAERERHKRAYQLDSKC